MHTSPHDEWPLDEYMAAWKSFRENSDEDAITAEHLISRGSWPKKDGVIICDIGCGDGRLLEAILKSIKGGTKVTEARLVDPDGDLLEEAYRCVASSNLVGRITRENGYASDLFPGCAGGADVILAVHVVYLMRNGQFEKMLRECPFDTPTYVVLDAKKSVFTDLWRETAPKYFSRSLKAHESIENLPGKEFSVRESVIEAKIKRHLFDSNLAPWLLSLLCYRDMTGNVDQKLRAKVYEIINKYTGNDNDYVHCQSVCYEVVRRKS